MKICWLNEQFQENVSTSCGKATAANLGDVSTLPTSAITHLHFAFSTTVYNFQLIDLEHRASNNIALAPNVHLEQHTKQRKCPTFAKNYALAINIMITTMPIRKC